MKTYTINCSVELEGYVTVEANDENEALEKFNDLDWTSDFIESDIVNWESKDVELED